MWILKCGSVRIRATGTQPGLVLARIGPGSSVGEMGLLNQQPRCANVCADNDVDAYVLTREKFSTILNDTPEMGKNILIFITGQLALRLRDMNQLF
jgi:CRP-like cAMP-binding protein